MVLVLIEAMKDSSIFHKEATGNMLDVIIQDPDFWLADVSGLWLHCLPFSRGRHCPSLPLHPSLTNPAVLV